MNSRCPREILAISGLLTEAAIARGPGVRAIAGAQALTTLEQSLLPHTRGVISFGIAGGLDARLRTGTIVIPRNVVDAEQCWTTDQVWADALAERFPACTRADLAGTNKPVITIGAKAQLGALTKAVAVDTESHIAARAAHAHALPFAVLRVISDPADRALPSAALVALRTDGGLDLGAVLRDVSRAPGQIPQLVRSGLDTRVALRNLARGRARLGPGLAYPDFGELLFDVP